MEEENYDIVSLISEIFEITGDSKYLSFFENKIKSLDGYNSYSVFGSYFALLQNLQPSEVSGSMDFLVNMGKNDTANFKRFMATSNLNNIKLMSSAKLEGAQDEKMKSAYQAIIEKADKAIQEIIEIETNPQLVMRYKGFAKA